jgi:hypothetical protein
MSIPIERQSENQFLSAVEECKGLFTRITQLQGFSDERLSQLGRSLIVHPHLITYKIKCSSDSEVIWYHFYPNGKVVLETTATISVDDNASNIPSKVNETKIEHEEITDVSKLRSLIRDLNATLERIQ